MNNLRIDILQEFVDSQDRASCLSRVLGDSHSDRMWSSSSPGMHLLSYRRYATSEGQRRLREMEHRGERREAREVEKREATNQRAEQRLNICLDYPIGRQNGGNFTGLARRADIVSRLSAGEPIRSISRESGVDKNTVMKMRLDMGNGAEDLLIRHGYDKEVWGVIYSSRSLSRDNRRDSMGRRIGAKASPRSEASIHAELALVAAYAVFVRRPMGEDDLRGPFALCDKRVGLAWSVEDFVRAILRESNHLDY